VGKSKKLEKGSRRWMKATERRREGGKMEWWGMRVNIIEQIQTYIQSDVELEANPVIVVVWRRGEAITQTGRLGIRRARSTFIGTTSEE
jgi:hypothetical protein